MTSRNEVARFLGISEAAFDFPIHGVSSSSAPRSGSLAFIKAWNPASANTVSAHTTTLFLVPAAADVDGSHVIPVENPRLEFARVVRELLVAPSRPTIATTAVVSDGSQIGSDVSIGHFTVIEDGVVLGDAVEVGSHCVLRSGVSLGDHTKVGSHASIGGSGFGFEVEADGTPVRIHHLGGVEIGRMVEIGQHVSIAQGTIEPTRIGDHVKIDDGVFIAHNVQVGEAAFIIAGAEISGSVTIGKRAWISPEASILNQINVGDDALVGIGAVVIRDVPANTVVSGVPAKERGPRHKDVASP